MRTPSNCRIGLKVAALVAASLVTSTMYADEIRLKDGKKLYGVIVAYEDNMFKVKTDFGYVLVEKDKIAQIIPGTPATGEPAKAQPQPAAKPSNETPVKAEPAVEKTTTGGSAEAAKREKTAAVVTHANARPEIPTATPVMMDTTAPALKNSNAAPKSGLTSAVAAPPPPKEEPAPLKEEIQGNLYINHEFGFHMYKAPSWQIIDGAGQTLPNAIVAMGTSNESTLMVIGHEKTKASLESAAKTVENRLREVYENYRLISRAKDRGGWTARRGIQISWPGGPTRLVWHAGGGFPRRRYFHDIGNDVCGHRPDPDSGKRDYAVDRQHGSELEVEPSLR